jgi:D-sedoheptulose 7-phosphate isomerase
MDDLVQDYIAQLRHTMARLPMQQVERVIEALIAAQWSGHTVYLFGNGGSAATASHFACDLAKNTIIDGLPRIRAIALTDSLPLITAWANDTDYEHIFAEQLRGLVQPKDVVIGISGSGRSPNVLNAILVAQQAGATTIGITGFDGGLLADMVDVPLVVPSDSMERIEDAHLILEHAICSTIRESQRPHISLIFKLRPELAADQEIGVEAEHAQVLASLG